jgi:transglutaminase-like putative cysteine protease
LTFARSRQGASAAESGRWPVVAILVLVMVTSWAVDDAVGLGAVALMAGAAASLFAAFTVRRIAIAIPRLGAAAIAGSAAAVVLAAWQAHVAPGPSLLDQLGAGLGESLAAVWAGHPPETVGLVIGVAALAWANAYAATAGLLLKRRLREPLALLGIPLLASMSFTPAPGIGPLVLFAAATLLLNLWVVEQRRDVAWRRHAVAMEPAVPARIRHAGGLATLGVVVLAWALATVAVGAPLGGVLNDAGSFLRNTAPGIGDWAGPRYGAPVFGQSFTIGNRFDPTDDPVLVVQGALSQRYLRAATYDTYTGTGWTQAAVPARRVPAGEWLFPQPPLELGNGWRESEATWRITARQPLDKLILPIRSLTVSRPADVDETAGAHFVTAIRSPVKAGTAYAATGSDAVATDPQLDGAGVVYPAVLPDAYLSLAGVTRETINKAVAVAGEGTPYAKASALAGYLQSAPFAYRKEVNLPAGQDVVDWLLFDPAGQAGFCEQYASAMVVMARAVGIPARLARGYAGGQPQADGTLLFRAADSHAWAELYFPGYGWQVFEATPGTQPVDRQAASGVETPIESPSTAAAQGPLRDLRDFADANAQPGSSQVAPIGTIYGALLVLVLAAAAVAAGVLRSRRPPTALTPQQVWQQLIVAGERAGITRSASQTPYEYADSLRRHVPRRSGEITSIAGAMVVATYSPPGHRVAPPRNEWAGLRRSLARIELRRRVRRLRWRRGG